MTKNFRTLEGKLSPDARARAVLKAERFRDAMALDELREARRLTQQHLAERLGINQSAISKLERRADMYVSTLQHTIEAMGGRLDIRAVFPEGVVSLRGLGTRPAPREGR
jgi:DNA-binding XRE family transcriptional regulator